jgi:hypothetical protein
MSNLKIALALSAITVLAACGGGGNEVAEVAYNYKQHDGAYRCLQEGDGYTPQSYTLAFTEKTLTITGDNLTQPVIFDDKVGFIEGKPYYSEKTPSTETAYSQTIYFKNNKLEIVLGLSANVPDKLSEGPTESLSCDKL